MTELEVKKTMLRIHQYRELARKMDQIKAALNQLAGPLEKGKRVRSPFSGSPREQRTIVAMNIQFSESKSGSPPVTLSLGNLDIEAAVIGDTIEGMLLGRLDAIRTTMEEL